MKKHIDLMPPWAQEAKGRKSLIKILAVIQGAIFLLLIALAFALNYWKQQTQDLAETLSRQIAEFDSEPSRVAAELQATLIEISYEGEFLAAISSSSFVASHLEFIYEATPENVEILRIDYSRQELLIVSVAADLNIAEQHRANLSSYFTYVSTGRITRTEGGYTYEIRVSSARTD